MAIEKHISVTVAIIIAALLVSYLPIIVFFTMRIVGKSAYNYLRLMSQWLELILYTNAAVNPLIYFRRNSDLKNGVKRMLGMNVMEDILSAPGVQISGRRAIEMRHCHVNFGAEEEPDSCVDEHMRGRRCEATHSRIEVEAVVHVPEVTAGSSRSEDGVRTIRDT